MQGRSVDHPSNPGIVTIHKDPQFVKGQVYGRGPNSGGFTYLGGSSWKGADGQVLNSAGHPPQGPTAQHPGNPADVIAPLTPFRANQLVNSSVQQAYGPGEHALQNQVTSSDQNQGNISNWFGQYQQALQAGRSTTQAAYDAASHSLQNYGLQAQQNDQGANRQAVQQMQSDAANRGATVDAGTQALGNEAATSRAGALASNIGAVGSLGANAAAFNDQLSAIGRGNQGQAAQQEFQRGQTLRGDLGNLKGQAGAYGNSVRLQLMQNERNWNATQQQIGIKGLAANTAAASAASLSNFRSGQLKQGQQKINQNGQKLKIDQQNANTNSGRLNETIRNDQQKNAINWSKVRTGSNGKKYVSASSERSFIDSINQAYTFLQDAGGRYGSNQSNMIRAMQQGASYRNTKTGKSTHVPRISNYAIQAAVDLINAGFIQGGTRSSFERVGIDPGLMYQGWFRQPGQNATPVANIQGLNG